MRALGFQAHYPAEAISVAGLTEVVFARDSFECSEAW